MIYLLNIYPSQPWTDTRLRGMEISIRLIPAKFSFSNERVRLGLQGNK